MIVGVRIVSGVMLGLMLIAAKANAQTSLSNGLEISLLADYTQSPLQGIDSIVGKIDKKSGPSLSYEIGGVSPPGAPRFGGSFTNSAANVPKESLAWIKTQKVPGKTMTIAYTKDQKLMVSVEFTKEGANFSATAKTPEEIAEVLLLVTSLREKLAK